MTASAASTLPLHQAGSSLAAQVAHSLEGVQAQLQLRQRGLLLRQQRRQVAAVALYVACRQEAGGGAVGRAGCVTGPAATSCSCSDATHNTQYQLTFAAQLCLLLQQRQQQQQRAGTVARPALCPLTAAAAAIQV